MPIIIISSPSPTDNPPYAPRSPSPGEWSRYVADGRGFDVGHDIRPHTPATCDHTWSPNPPPPSAPITPNKFWDNITIPYDAYFHANSSPDHRTPPPAGYRNNVHWDTPIPPQEYTPESVRGVEEPVTGPSNYWQNVTEQCLTPPRRRWGPDPTRYHLNRFLETEVHSWSSETSGSNTATELLPQLEFINGIHGESPQSTPEPPLQPTNPDPPNGNAD